MPNDNYGNPSTIDDTYGNPSTINDPEVEVNGFPDKKVSAITQCTPLTDCPDPKVIKKSNEIKEHLQEGDIILTQGDSPEAQLIRSATGMDYSHAAIIAKDSSGNLVAIHAPNPRIHPAIVKNPPETLFRDTNLGGVFRPKNCETAQQAANWASDKVGNPEWKYDLFDPYSADPEKTYCSDFVYQAFQVNGINLVENPINLLSKENEKRTAEAARQYDIEKNGIRSAARWVSDSKVLEHLKQQGGGGNSGGFIAPGQLANSKAICQIIIYQPEE